jgi:hypothetical protein
MKFLLSSFLILLCLASFSQEKNDLGIITGTSYYFGDLNPGTQFYQPSPAFGFIFRNNRSDMISLRFSGMLGSLKGTAPQSYYLPNNPEGFSTRLFSLETTCEIGFLPYHTFFSQTRSFSPYVVLGAGLAYSNGYFMPNIPFGIGAKYSPANRWTIGLEWRLHKTFFDQIDGYQNITSNPRSFIHNNDWFGIAGFFVTYRLINKGAVCPAYK